jgi:small-conductance mechanosensitive channel
MDANQIVQTLTTIGIAFGLKAVGAIVVWVVGRFLIGLAVRLVSAALEKQRVDPTVLRYLGTVISVTLNIILVVAILGYFGVETTTFAAIMASVGVAIGLAWSGLLANFAAGAFMKERLAKISNVKAEPAPDVEILEFNLAGPVLAVRPYCHTDHYWQVYFDTNRAIRETFGEAGFPVPEQHLVLRNDGAVKAEVPLREAAVAG